MKAAFTDAPAGAAHLTLAAPSAWPDSVAIDDLTLLLGAVCDRLRLASAAVLGAVPPPPHAGDPVDVQGANLLECVEALDLLHVILSQQVKRLRDLERGDTLPRNDLV